MIRRRKMSLRIKMFQSGNSAVRLEGEINEWLSKNEKDVVIKNVIWGFIGGNREYPGVMIWYTDVPNDTLKEGEGQSVAGF